MQGEGNEPANISKSIHSTSVLCHPNRPTLSPRITLTDTVSIRTARPILPAITRAVCAGCAEPLPGWYLKWYVKQRCQANSTDLTQLEGWHKPSGLYIIGTANIVKCYSASLPRQLYGSNGVQLKSDADLVQAFSRVHAILDQITDEPLIDENLIRLDVAINIHHPQPERLVLALRDARHPWIRSATEKYATGSIRFPGTKVVFSAYWKLRAKRSGERRRAWCTPDVLRVELQLKDADKINRFLGHEAPKLPDFPTRADLYRGFCSFMTRFPRRKQPGNPCDMPGLLALCQAHDVRTAGGQSVMDWHRQSVSASGHQKMCKKVAAITLDFLEIDWAQIFPNDRIPQTMDVFPDGRTAVVAEQFLVPPQ